MRYVRAFDREFFTRFSPCADYNVQRGNRRARRTIGGLCELREFCVVRAGVISYDAMSSQTPTRGVAVPR
jgi:hypothetical protein